MSEVLKYIPFLWLLRIPILAAAVLLYLGIKGRRSPLLRGLFDVKPDAVWLPTLLCSFAAASIAISMDVVLKFASVRYGMPDLDDSHPSTIPSPLPAHFEYYLYRYSWVSMGFGAIAVAPILYGLCRGTDGFSFRKFRSMVAGFVFGCIAAIFIIGIGLAVNVHRPLAWLVRLSPEGYFTDRETNNPHSAALLLLLISFTLYCVVGVSAGVRIATKRAGATLAVGGLMVILILCTWLTSVLTVLSFFWDKFYVPESAFVILLLVWGAFLRTDRYFKVAPRQVKEVAPQHILEATNAEYAILISAAGGGIHISAWTAQVLSGLAVDLGPQFARCVRLISSVSGGGVGALYFLASYRQGDLDPDFLRRMFQSASRSSLDFAAWGFIYPDLFSSFFPLIPKHIDRGWALEKGWARDWNLPATLDPWREAALRGEMPAVLFNTTIAETGESIAIGTTELSAGSSRPGFRRTFSEVYPGLDLSPVTAARLSAGFPIVTPASAPLGQEPRYHFVDGGYYDNYGMASLITWLAQAVPKDGSSKVKRILILRIFGFGTHRSDTSSRRWLGWFYQIRAPFDTLISVRSASQFARQQTELELLKESMLLRGVKVEDIAFECPVDDPPLSWHLTKTEIEAIEDSWPAMKPQRTIVRAFLENHP